jgi:2-oxoglutarate ferredoxin oxidoreductase subunit beta
MTSAYPKSVRPESKPHSYCPGCGHPNVMKALGAVIDELGLQRRVALGVDIGCSLLAWNFFNLDTIETHHGRTIPTMVGFKRVRPGEVCIAYVGDGGAYAIGSAHLMHAALRNENILVIVVNNTLYGMTGGQVAPTTLPGMKAKTAPGGASERNLHAPELIRHLNADAYVARSMTTVQAHLRKTLRGALEHQLAGRGFAFVEVLSPCPLNWGTSGDPQRTLDFLEKEVAAAYPVKAF